MKKLSSVLALVLVSVMLVFCFAGCASNEQKTRLNEAYDNCKSFYDECATILADVNTLASDSGYFDAYEAEKAAFDTLIENLNGIKDQLAQVRTTIDENIEFYTKEEADKAIADMETWKTQLSSQKTILETMKTALEKLIPEG